MPRLPEGYTIEPETGALVPLRRRRLSRMQFMRRLAVIERVALKALQIDPAVDLFDRSVLMTLAETRDLVSEVNLDDPETEYGVAVAINALVSLPQGTPGRILASDASARVDAWLADFPQPGEPVL